MKILHINNPSDVAYTIVTEQQKQFQVHLVTLVRSEYKFHEDIYIKGVTPTSMYTFIKMIRWADFIHLHDTIYGRTKKRIYGYASIGKPVVHHFHGMDLRLHVYGDKDLGPCIIATPDLWSLAPQGVWIEHPVETEIFAPTQRISSPKLKVGMRSYKTTYIDYKFNMAVNAALRELEARRGDFELVVGQKIPRTRMPQFINSCDIIVDPKTIGWYGRFACESMSCGKPVIAHMDPEVVARCAGHVPPIINSDRTTESVTESVVRLLEDEDERRRLGLQGRKYVLENCTAEATARKVMNFYHKFHPELFPETSVT